MYHSNENLTTIETAGIFGSKDPDVRAKVAAVKKQIAEAAPEVIVLNHTPAPTDTPARQARAIATALEVCEEIAPNADVYMVQGGTVDFFVETYRDALAQQERDWGTP